MDCPFFTMTSHTICNLLPLWHNMMHFHPPKTQPKDCFALDWRGEKKNLAFLLWFIYDVLCSLAAITEACQKQTKVILLMTVKMDQRDVCGCVTKTQNNAAAWHYVTTGLNHLRVDTAVQTNKWPVRPILLQLILPVNSGLHVPQQGKES